MKLVFGLLLVMSILVGGILAGLSKPARKMVLNIFVYSPSKKLSRWAWEKVKIGFNATWVRITS